MHDGIVIDLSAMRTVLVDPAGRTALVQGGALWSDVDHETQAHGLATTGGIVGHTGVAGLTLGGGIGFLMRKHGLAVDNLLAAEVVTAEGSVVGASTDEHPDLFWALRGGSGNFGVVTSFRFALRPLGPSVMAGPVFWAADDTVDVLRFYRDFAAMAPDELGSVVRLGTVPPLPVIPDNLHWRPAIAVDCRYAGAVDDGERAVRALRRFGTPLVDLLAPTPYVAHQRRHSPPRVALLLEIHEPCRTHRRDHRRDR
jgi:FAD/FMN-containing dehydrogenase